MANNKDISSTIKRTIQEADAPAIFFISDFAEFGYEYVRKVLSALVSQGELMRLANGIYIKSKMTKFGPLQPSAYQIVKAIAAHDSAHVLPTGAAAENMLGLSEQGTCSSYREPDHNPKAGLTEDIFYKQSNIGYPMSGDEKHRGAKPDR